MSHYDPSKAPAEHGVVAHAFVGSRVTCNPAPTDTDCDELVFAMDAFRLFEFVEGDGYVWEGGKGYCPDAGEGRFASFRRGEHNLIVTECAVFYDKFLRATALAKQFNLLRKEDRIDLFKALLYGECGK